MKTLMNLPGRSPLKESLLTSVVGGQDPPPSSWGNAVGMIGFILTPFLMYILNALQPSWNYTDRGANFMCLMLEWAECYYGINGKSQDSLKCKAIIVTLKRNGFDTEQILEVFRREESKVRSALGSCA